MHGARPATGSSRSGRRHQGSGSALNGLPCPRTRPRNVAFTATKSCLHGVGAFPTRNTRDFEGCILIDWLAKPQNFASSQGTPLCCECLGVETLPTLPLPQAMPKKTTVHSFKHGILGLQRFRNVITKDNMECQRFLANKH